jgi:hypothetical protein
MTGIVHYMLLPPPVVTRVDDTVTQSLNSEVMC